MKKFKLNTLIVQEMNTRELEKFDGGILILGNKIGKTEPTGVGVVIGISAGVVAGGWLGPIGAAVGGIGGGVIGWILGKRIAK